MTMLRSSYLCADDRRILSTMGIDVVPKQYRKSRQTPQVGEELDEDVAQDLCVALLGDRRLDDEPSDCDDDCSCTSCMLREAEKEYGHKPPLPFDFELAGRRLRTRCPVPA